jgi:hypothetical protein
MEKEIVLAIVVAQPNYFLIGFDTDNKGNEIIALNNIWRMPVVAWKILSDELLGTWAEAVCLEAPPDGRTFVLDPQGVVHAFDDRDHADLEALVSYEINRRSS